MKLVVTPKLSTAVPPVAATPEALIRLANVISVNCGLSMSTQRVTRIVRRYKGGVEHRGYDFFDFFTNAIQLDVETRHRLLADPEVMKAISYADPTGEQAVRNVMKAPTPRKESRDVQPQAQARRVRRAAPRDPCR